MAESEEELKSDKVGLKLNIKKTKIIATDLITSWQIDGETDIENRITDIGRGEEWVRCMQIVTWKLTLPCVK